MRPVTITRSTRSRRLRTLTGKLTKMIGRVTVTAATLLAIIQLSPTHAGDLPTSEKPPFHPSEAQNARPNLPTRESGHYSVYCAEEWTKRGVLNQEMYAYCEEQQNEAYDALSA